MNDLPIHPELAPLAFLLGTWEGEGAGDYPTTQPFSYRETLEFTHVGDAFLLYREESWTSEGESIHFEQGFLRPLGEGRLDLVLAHQDGVAELSGGTVRGTTIATASTTIARTSDGSPITSLTRRYQVEGDTLSYEIDMAMESVPNTLHVWATLERSGA